MTPDVTTIDPEIQSLVSSFYEENKTLGITALVLHAPDGLPLAVGGDHIDREAVEVVTSSTTAMRAIAIEAGNRVSAPTFRQILAEYDERWILVVTNPEALPGHGVGIVTSDHESKLGEIAFATQKFLGAIGRELQSPSRRSG